jgi:hypothetical protein
VAGVAKHTTNPIPAKSKTHHVKVNKLKGYDQRESDFGGHAGEDFL